MKCAFYVLLLIGLVSSQTCRLRSSHHFGRAHEIGNRQIPSQVMKLLRDNLYRKHMSLMEVVCATRKLSEGPIYRLHYKLKDLHNNKVQERGFQVLQNMKSSDIPLDK